MGSILIRTAVIVLLLAVLGFRTGLLFGPSWGWSLFSLGLIGLLVHQATLEIDSTPGKGSRFTAKFPARRVVAARARTETI